MSTTQEAKDYVLNAERRPRKTRLRLIRSIPDGAEFPYKGQIQMIDNTVQGAALTDAEAQTDEEWAAALAKAQAFLDAPKPLVKGVSDLTPDLMEYVRIGEAMQLSVVINGLTNLDAARLSAAEATNPGEAEAAVEAVEAARVAYFTAVRDLRLIGQEVAAVENWVMVTQAGRDWDKMEAAERVFVWLSHTRRSTSVGARMLCDWSQFNQTDLKEFLDRPVSRD
jgi:hypothetical protein